MDLDATEALANTRLLDFMVDRVAKANPYLCRGGSMLELMSKASVGSMNTGGEARSARCSITDLSRVAENTVEYNVETIKLGVLPAGNCIPIRYTLEPGTNQRPL